MSPAVHRPVGRTRWIFSGLRYVHVGTDTDYELGDGFSLVKPNSFLLSARIHEAMNGDEYEEAAKVSRYLVFKSVLPRLDTGEPDIRQKAVEMFQNGLIAFQIIKPLQSLGFIFQGAESDGPGFSLETVEHRQPMDGGQWSRMRPFDQDLIDQVPDMIRRVSKIMGESNAERKNAIILLQLALENFHQLIAGLLCVMGMEAITRKSTRPRVADRTSISGDLFLVVASWFLRLFLDNFRFAD